MSIKIFSSILTASFRSSLLCQRNLTTQYKSAISLSNLYPQSSLDIAKPVTPPQKDNRQFSGYIPIDKLEITYSRSTGPGGQNVNKVNTKVDIRFHLLSAEWLDDDTKALLAQRYHSRINKDGYLIIRSDKTRSQFYNQADAITKLRELIYRAIESSKTSEPSEETLHIWRKRKERANMERLAKKKNHSLKKLNRQVPDI